MPVPKYSATSASVRSQHCLASRRTPSNEPLVLSSAVSFVVTFPHLLKCGKDRTRRKQISASTLSTGKESVMVTFDTKKLMVSLFAGLNLLLVAQTLKAAEAKQAPPKRYKLVATLETTQWGWLDPNEPPKLTVDSGDIVSIETMMHAHDKIQPGVSMDEIVALRKANPGGGPHSLTGPIYVNGAEPGDVMEIRILKITPKRFGFNFNLPGKEFTTIGAL